MGVSGSGKSTIGSALANELRYPFVDGDDLHSKESVEKMAKAIALNDEDRQGWLERINARLAKANSDSAGVVIAASLLKAQYRKTAVANISPRPLLVLLSIPLQGSIDRIASRKDHFMPPELARSQFEILDETTEIDLVVDGTQRIEKIVREIIDHLHGETGVQ